MPDYIAFTFAGKVAINPICFLFILALIVLMTPKELDKEIGKCVHRIGILSHELKKRVNA